MKKTDKLDILLTEDEEFDYQKEILAIEAQEKELEARRLQRKKELDELKAKRDAAAAANTVTSKKSRKEARAQKKETEWLGGQFDGSKDDVENPKKSKKGIIILLIIILAALALGGYFVYKNQVSKKIISDFDQKVASFQSEKLDGLELGDNRAYFDDFMKQCYEAIENKDMAAIAELELKWDDVSAQLAEVVNGKTSLDALITSAKESLSKYKISDELRESYDKLMADIDAAEKSCDYSKIAALTKDVDALVTNLNSDNKKQIQQLKNDITSTELDSKYLSDEQANKFKEYDERVKACETEENYAVAIETLNAWKAEAKNVAEAIAAKKAEEAAKAKAESESRAKAESIAESKARAEAESKALESKKKETQKQTQKPASSNTNTSTTVSGDYVLSQSSSKYLSASDVSGLSSYQLMIARNEIYARHGYIFRDAELKQYFNSKSWYNGTVSADSFSATVFNDYELKNIDLIRSYE